MASKNPERMIFVDDYNRYRLNASAGAHQKPFIKDQRGWCLFGPCDVRGREECYQFMLQQLPGQKTPRVKAGCRYYTLRDAWKHWGVFRTYRSTARNNECAQAVAIIRLMLLQAQAWGLMSLYSTPIRFDSTLIQRKRK